MQFIKYFHNKKLKYDLINKFIYNNINKIPELKKIVLNIGCKKTEIKKLSANFLALRLITTNNHKGTLTTAKKPNILLKIKKGDPVGCKLILQKTTMFNFFSKILVESFSSSIKEFEELNFTNKKLKNTLSYELNDILKLPELEKNYNLLKNTTKLGITFVTNSKNKSELLFLLKSLQLPIKNN